MRPRHPGRALCALVLSGLLGCSTDAPTALDPTARPSAAPSSAAPAPSPDLVLPPPPAGGFDPAVQVVIDGAPTLIAEVARRPDQRARGLMQRTSLADDAGMLFLFPGRSESGFYMLGTLIPLSIAYVEGDRVVSTVEMTPCPGQVCPTYPSAGPYSFAVEAPAGFFSRWGVSAGSRVRIVGDVLAPE